MVLVAGSREHEEISIESLNNRQGNSECSRKRIVKGRRVVACAGGFLLYDEVFLLFIYLF